MITLNANELEAIESLDGRALRDAVHEVTASRSTTALRRLELHRLGHYVSRAESRISTALIELGKAKSSAKVLRLERDLSDARWDLISAVDQMKARAEEEKQDANRFRILDRIMEPPILRPDMSVTVSYSWRPAGEENWRYGSIGFRHRHVASFYHQAGSEHRKPSPRQREREEEEALLQVWFHLRDLALFSVRDFFRDGGDGASIPEEFTAVTERGSLNNFSLRFWEKRI
ncbi:hypothetical protein PE067_20855 [Paracoccus sp. DMF-8]|uniref:hypothetical protein n=1 Tax=Paracoccus sp. DMF-8 TaxID=3019445 RepID=UPI0023E46DAA|nr:hypothetical protein [Paracoccus sp. DMF-8]MDF3608377.1 hypothetical protein [Paracoccus sp. DMF-8]